MNSDSSSAIAGALGLTSPFWLTFLNPAYQVVIAILGFVLLILTIRNKWLDLKIKAATLRELSADDEDTKEVIIDGET